MKKIKIAVIGATGSVGGAVLDICARFERFFEVTAMAAASNRKKLVELGRRHGAKVLCLTAEKNWDEDGFVCLGGVSGLTEIAELPCVEHIVFASSGTSAIYALQRALARGLDVSLANKESIVAAGPWVTPLVKRASQLRPIDSEHSAVWQCLERTPKEEISRVWLTASGGPFRDYGAKELENVKPKDALKHPVWAMGQKITIDSATLMNKGIECIEAMRLFDLPHEKVDALVHPKSQVHGITEFIDGTVKFLLSPADMRLPAAAAVFAPRRLDLLSNGFSRIEPESWDLKFERIDAARFPCYRIAREAGRAGGAYPPLLVGADESAVKNFLREKISFTDMANVVSEVFERYNGSAPKTLEDAVALVEEGERTADEICENRGSCR